MGPIQSGVNQSLAILSLASSQNPQAQANRQATASTSKLEKISKPMPPIELTQEQLDTFKEFKEVAIKSNIEAGRVNTAADIKSDKFFDKQKGITFGKIATGRPIEGYGIERYTTGVEEEPTFEFVGNTKTEEEPAFEFVGNTKIFNEFKNAHHVSVNELNKRLSAKQKIEADTKILKTILEEDN